MLKRFVDVVVSAGVLLLMSPLLTALALAIWMDSGTPVLFRHQRVGLAFRLFHVLKFRTMRVQTSGPSVTVSGDDRVTAVGKYLRMAKLDELPQFWNVLVGDMSLVGPRPEVAEYVELFRERYRRVLTVKPGITDLASIRFRYEERILAGSPEPLREYTEHILPAKLELAEEYVNTHSALKDVSILFHTAVAIVR